LTEGIRILSFVTGWRRRKRYTRLTGSRRKCWAARPSGNSDQLLWMFISYFVLFISSFRKCKYRLFESKGLIAGEPV